MPAPPYSGREDHAQEPELAQFFDRRKRKISGLIPLHDVRRDLFRGKVTNALLQLKLLVVQLEIQGTS